MLETLFGSFISGVPSTFSLAQVLLDILEREEFTACSPPPEGNRDVLASASCRPSVFTVFSILIASSKSHVLPVTLATPRIACSGGLSVN